MKKTPAKMKKKSSGDDVLKKRFGTGWKKAQTAGYTVKGGKIVSPPKKAPTKFNKGLKAASKAGKLDNNPKFKAAVDASPAKMKKAAMKMKKESMAMMKKSVAMMKKASAMKMKMEKSAAKLKKKK